MPDRLLFPDPETAADALTFAARAAALIDDAVRLQAVRGVLAITAAPLAPRGIGDATPTVLALRTLAVDPELECDLVVSASSLRPDPDDPCAVLLPDTGLTAAWAGVAPPRGDWSDQGTLEAAELSAKARGGMARVAHALPTDPGEDVVRTVRAAVWGEHDPALAGLPLGAAFAAAALGFLGPPETARVLVSGRWTRLSLRRGHVLVRGPVASGLTAVRATGGR